ncbi:hypothetical protein C2E19_27995 [Pseudomonas sp. DTU12.3]|nr:hypothetical protein C2E19_27995 [Pseudomonas sp. DTU12.3]
MQRCDEAHTADSQFPEYTGSLWQGSLLPPGRGAALLGTATQPSGSKFPRHRFLLALGQAAISAVRCHRA